MYKAYEVFKKTMHYGRISFWRRNKKVKKLHKSYHLVQTQINTYFNGQFTKENKLQSVIADDDLGKTMAHYELVLSYTLRGQVHK